MTGSVSESLSRWAAYSDLVAALARGVPCLEAHALWGSARALLIAALSRETRRTALVVTSGPAERHRTARDVAFFLSSALGPKAEEALTGRRVLECPAGESGSW